MLERPVERPRESLGMERPESTFRALSEPPRGYGESVTMFAAVILYITKVAEPTLS